MGWNALRMCSRVSVCVPCACGLKVTSRKLTLPPSATDPVQPSERTGSAVAGPLYHALGSPEWGLTGTLRSMGEPDAVQV